MVENLREYRSLDSIEYLYTLYEMYWTFNSYSSFTDLYIVPSFYSEQRTEVSKSDLYKVSTNIISVQSVCLLIHSVRTDAQNVKLSRNEARQ